MTGHDNPLPYARLSIAGSLLTLGLKFGAWFLTDSVGLLSDALESVINLAGGVVALAALGWAARPSDENHAFGHHKAEYLSSGAEGLLILAAAAGIIHAAVDRFFEPTALVRLGWGLAVALAAAAINLAVARVMLQAARRLDSLALEADARHLLTDVWTTAGLVLGLGVLIVAPPSWRILDPLLALVMALNIVWTGLKLMRRAVGGLMDEALPQDEVAQVKACLAAWPGGPVNYRDLRTRKAGRQRFIEFKILLPGQTSVQAAHDLTLALEAEIERCLPNSTVVIHVEPESRKT